MPAKLKVLILEDNAADAELTLYELRRAGYEPEWKRAETEREYLALLDQGWEIILADYNLPAFDGMRALGIMRERGLDIPLIIVSGTIGEDKAVAAMKAGANDYIMKDRLARLGPAVERELRDAVERRERKRAEEALRASEERFRQLAELLPQIVFETDIKGNFTFANRHGLESFGYSHEDIQSEINIFAMIAPEDQERIKTRFKEVVRGAETAGREYQVMRKDGGKFPILMHANTILEDGVPIGIRGIAIDITERKRAEEALQASQTRYRLLIDNAQFPIVVVSAVDLRVLFINEHASRLFGVSAPQAVGLHASEFWPRKEDLYRFVHLIKVRGEVKDFETELCSKSGARMTVLLSSNIIEFAGQQANITVFQDITERKRTEEALHQAEENFRRSLDESPLGIRVMSAKGEMLYANRAILDFYGYKDIEELKSTPVKNRYTPESYAEYQLRKKKRTNGEDYPSEYEISIIRKTGEIRCLQVFRKNILWNGQKQFQTIYQDITERKRTEEKLRKTLAGLRNALGGIIQVLSATTEKRDPYTAGHQIRVADLARAIGQEMGLAADRVEGLRIAGTIHDIGKVSIPAEILSKPTRLTEIEYKLIQAHSQIGHDILGDIEFSWPIAEMVLQHHERVNGSGYPNHLKDEEILLEARILAVSDVVEAMASHRPYRPALGITAALEEIEKNKGILYDPDVVSACQTLFKAKRFNLK